MCMQNGVADSKLKNLPEVSQFVSLHYDNGSLFVLIFLLKELGEVW